MGFSRWGFPVGVLPAHEGISGLGLSRLTAGLSGVGIFPGLPVFLGSPSPLWCSTRGSDAAHSPQSGGPQRVVCTTTTLFNFISASSRCSPNKAEEMAHPHSPIPLHRGADSRPRARSATPRRCRASVGGARKDARFAVHIWRRRLVAILRVHRMVRRRFPTVTACDTLPEPSRDSRPIAPLHSPITYGNDTAENVSVPWRWGGLSSSTVVTSEDVAG